MFVKLCRNKVILFFSYNDLYIHFYIFKSINKTIHQETEKIMVITKIPKGIFQQRAGIPKYALGKMFCTINFMIYTVIAIDIVYPLGR